MCIADQPKLPPGLLCSLFSRVGVVQKASEDILAKCVSVL
jgi:hypothetical protein